MSFRYIYVGHTAPNKLQVETKDINELEFKMTNLRMK